MGAKTQSEFLSRGVRARARGQGLLGDTLAEAEISESAYPAVLNRIMDGDILGTGSELDLKSLLGAHSLPAVTSTKPMGVNIAAGKNTYTYDAHTYHTKVPPQGIAQVLRHYLPDGGLVLDPFGGSGMTGVASRTVGCDCILNELSPAACFISNRFTTSQVSHQQFEAMVDAVLRDLSSLRRQLYSTNCRECGKSAELLYMVWSYRVICGECGYDFQLWDVCREYGQTVKEHRILNEFPCPQCSRPLKKSRLKRTVAEPVLVGYKCCGSRQQEVTHIPSDGDLKLIQQIQTERSPARGYFPNLALPDGVNLRQPKKHGLDSIEKFYTKRNLVALSEIWRTIHKIESPELAAHLAFVFTSLYQRVTKLSEFRFWGGSGNTAHFNVPFISNEANVFVTFERKARTIQDHLESTAAQYRGTCVTINGSATDLTYLPDESIDLIFTDPPFGANINYSEMNLLWESWLGRFTVTKNEAIINRVQRKDVPDYQALMLASLRECYRVLRKEHWLMLVFMNSSREVWEALRYAVNTAGFEIVRTEIFDKRHGTFKQFVSENTAGMDLVLHCKKPAVAATSSEPSIAKLEPGSIKDFLETRKHLLPKSIFLHVDRPDEIDFRTLYSEWLSGAIKRSSTFVDFSSFRLVVEEWIRNRQ